MQDTNKYKVYKAITAVGKWLLFAIVSFLILFPVLWIFVSSITPPGELFKMPIDYIPDHPTLESYKFLIENVGLLEKIGNTVLIVGVTIVDKYCYLCHGGIWIFKIQNKGDQHCLRVHYCNNVDSGSCNSKTVV